MITLLLYLLYNQAVVKIVLTLWSHCITIWSLGDLTCDCSILSETGPNHFNWFFFDST